MEDIARRAADTFKWGAAIITKEIEYIKVPLYKKQMRPMTRRTMLSKIGGESHTMDISSKIRHGPTTRQFSLALGAPPTVTSRSSAESSGNILESTF